MRDEPSPRESSRQSTRVLEVGEVYRYPRLGNARAEWVSTGALTETLDGLASLLHVTLARDGTLASLERGINPIGRVVARGGERTPAVLVGSSPHKAGTVGTPWEDEFKTDAGLVRYFGDAKPGSSTPESTPGNRVLIEQHALHVSLTRDRRLIAAPLFLFRAVPYDGRIKGQRRFEGLAWVMEVERVRQFSEADGRSFENFAYDLELVDLSPSRGRVSWEWIHDRNDPSREATATMRHAPEGWRHWVDEGRHT